MADSHRKVSRPDPQHVYPNDPRADEPPRDDNLPRLAGGPATEAVPGTHRENVVSTPEDDGGESLLSGQPRETGGERDD